MIQIMQMRKSYDGIAISSGNCCCCCHLVTQLNLIHFLELSCVSRCSPFRVMRLLTHYLHVTLAEMVMQSLWPPAGRRRAEFKLKGNRSHTMIAFYSPERRRRGEEKRRTSRPQTFMDNIHAGVDHADVLMQWDAIAFHFVATFFLMHTK